VLFLLVIILVLVICLLILKQRWGVALAVDRPLTDLVLKKNVDEKETVVSEVSEAVIELHWNDRGV
jgi:cell division protein FtsL